MECTFQTKAISAAEMDRRRNHEAVLRAAAFEKLPAKMLGLEQALKHTYRYSNDHTRMETVLRLRPRMDPGDWLTLLGDAWTCSDNIRKFTSDLRRILGTAGPLLPMMTTDEQAALAELPNHISIYRGCSARHLTGACWSLDPVVARQFPGIKRYLVPDPVLVTAMVKKENVLALLFERQEREVVTFKARCISVDPISTH